MSIDEFVRSENKSDVLGRRPIVDAIFKSVIKSNDTASNVIGISAKWGDGKSFVKDALVDRLKIEKDNNNDLIVLDFNPWQWSEENKLQHNFLEQLRLELEEYDYKNIDRLEDLYKTSKEYKHVLFAMSAVLALVPQVLLCFEYVMPILLNSFFLGVSVVALFLGIIQLVFKINLLFYLVNLFIGLILYFMTNFIFYIILPVYFLIFVIVRFFIRLIKIEVLDWDKK